jgi:hypothetical protein
MRVFIILVFSLLIQLSNLQRVPDRCLCECCTTENCSPSLVDVHPLWFCTETRTCTQNNCVDWHQNACPPRDSPGQTRAKCMISGERILPTSLLMIGINLMIVLIKDKF